MTEHSTVVGGSTAGRTIQCPDWRTVFDKLPPQPRRSNPDADRGTMLHSVMAKHLGEDTLLQELVGYTELGWTLSDDDMFEAIEPAIRALDVVSDSTLEYEVEQRFSFPGILGAFGTVDLVGECDDFGLLLDWKFGFHAVSAERNDQLLFGACSARDAGWFKDRSKPIKLVIVQPRVEPGYSEWMTDHDELDRFEIRLKSAVRRGGLAIGDHCRYCAKAICPEHLKVAEKVTNIPHDASLKPLVPEGVLTPDQYGQRVEMARVAMSWGKAMLELAHEEAERGGKVTGFKLVDGQSRRHIIDEDKAKQRMRNLRIPANEYMTKKIGGIGVMEKAMKKHGVDVAKEMGRLTESRSSGTVLVREDNPAPAIIRTIPTLAKLEQKTE